MSTMWPDEYTGGSHLGATNGAYAKPAPKVCRHDYSDGDICSKCDMAKPIRGEK